MLTFKKEESRLLKMQLDEVEIYNREIELLQQEHQALKKKTKKIWLILISLQIYN